MIKMIKRIFFLVPIFAVLLVFGSCASGDTIPDTTALERYMSEAGKAMIWYTTDDPALIALRRSAGGAVITNSFIP